MENLVNKVKKIYNDCLKYCTINKKNHYWEFDYNVLGYNFRLPGINASLGISQLRKINNYLLVKKKIYNHYKEFFIKTDIRFFENKKDFDNNNWLNAISLPNSDLRLLKKNYYKAKVKKNYYKIIMEIDA